MYNNFGIFHFLYLFILLIIYLVLYLIKKKYTYKKIKWLFIILAVIPFIIDYLDFLWFIDEPNSDLFFNSLPFYLCDINSLVLVLALILNIDILNHYMRWSIIPFTLFAIILPDVGDGNVYFYNIRLILYFLSHGLTLIVAMLSLSEYPLKKKSGFYYSFLFLLGLSLISYLMTFIPKEYGYEINYAFMLWPPNAILGITYNLLEIPCLYMIINYLIFYLVVYLFKVLKPIEKIKKEITKIKTNKKEDFVLDRKNFFKQYLFLLVFIVCTILISIFAVIGFTKTNNNAEETEFDQLDISGEISLSNYTEFSINTVSVPNIVYSSTIKYKSIEDASKIKYEVKNSTFAIGDEINANTLLGYDENHNAVYATKDCTVLDVQEDYIICFVGFQVCAYSYINISQLSYIQKAKYIKVTTDEINYIDAKITKIDTLNINDNTFYIELTYDSDSTISLGEIVFFDDYSTYNVLSKKISSSKLDYGTVLSALYIDQNNNISNINIKVGNELNGNYEIIQVFEIVNNKRIEVDINNFTSFYIKK